MTTQTTVTVLGGTGMLGSIITDELSLDQRFKVTATSRGADLASQFASKIPGADWRILDAETADETRIADAISGAAWVINAIGVIKPYIRDDNPAEVERATRINSLFPHLLAKAVQRTGARVIQIATDCVYSGAKGRYTEPDSHDALDVYGKTKSLGETRNPAMAHLRCSIIGPEAKGHKSLLHWFLGQANGASVNGFTNHIWNGVTTLHFGRLCRGIIADNIEVPHLQHVIPGSSITKHELLVAFAREFGRGDMTINATEAATVIDRTLDTANPDLNARLWQAAGYDTPPTVEQMVAELARFPYRAA